MIGSFRSKLELGASHSAGVSVYSHSLSVGLEELYLSDLLHFSSPFAASVLSFSDSPSEYFAPSLYTTYCLLYTSGSCFASLSSPVVSRSTELALSTRTSYSPPDSLISSFNSLASAAVFASTLIVSLWAAVSNSACPSYV